MFPPEASLKPYQGGIPRYLVNRGVELETAKRWELGYDREFKRAVFTIRDVLGRLRGVCGRTIYKGKKPKYCHYSWDSRELKLAPFVDYDRYRDFLRPEKRLVCYGEHMIQAPIRRLLVTEGHLDVVMSDQAGVPAAGLQGARPSDEQVAIILELLDRDGEVVMAFDPDEAGDIGRQELYTKIDGRVPLYNVTFAAKTDPAKMVLEDAGAYRDLVAAARIYRC
jgi:DNA primase